MTRVLLSGNGIDVNCLSQLLKNYPDVQLSVVDRSFSGMFGNLVKVCKSDIVHHISAKLTGIVGIIWLCIFTILKKMGKKTILHWIGTDILEADPKILKHLVPLIDLHLVDAPWLVDELRVKGIESESVILPSIIAKQERLPLPKNLTALVYLGWKKAGVMEFYGGKVVESLIRSTPYKYIILGGTKFDDLPNVEYIDIVDHDGMKEIYARTTVLLRLIKHDALSHMVQESLSMGRYVIWSQKFPCCYHATDYNTALEYLKKLENVTELNIEGMKYFNTNLSDDVLIKKIVGFYRRVANE